MPGDAHDIARNKETQDSWPEDIRPQKDIPLGEKCGVGDFLFQHPHPHLKEKTFE